MDHWAAAHKAVVVVVFKKKMVTIVIAHYYFITISTFHIMVLFKVNTKKLWIRNFRKIAFTMTKKPPDLKYTIRTQDIDLVRQAMVRSLQH
jgi:hypothetical protein